MTKRTQIVMKGVKSKYRMKMKTLLNAMEKLSTKIIEIRLESQQEKNLTEHK